MMAGLKLNLGCGSRKLDGYLNVDRFGDPDLKFDLETFPWPWPDHSVCEIALIHVLEHLGRDTSIYLDIIQEIYRICQANAPIHIIVPHPRSDFFLDDPTHVRAITPNGLSLFSQRLNQEWAEMGAANSPLGLYLNVNFEIKQIIYKPSQHWFARHPDPNVDLPLLVAESALYNNLIEEIQVEWIVIKP